MAAPVPAYKPKPDPSVREGRYEAHWSSVKYEITFHKDHLLTYTWSGNEWHGSWYWDVKTRTLHMTECRVGGGEHVFTSHVKLDNKLTGTLTSDFSGNSTSVVPFSLKKLP